MDGAMTLLITGAGGLGSEMARMLAGAGRPCILADIRPASEEIAALPGVAQVVCDVTRPGALEDVMRAHGVTRVAHTAAVLSTGMRANQLAGLEVNLMGTARVLEAARACGVGRVVLVSSTTVLYAGFGAFGPGPIPEDAALRLISDRPLSLYAMTKLANEQLGLLWRDLHGLDTCALRLGAVIGGDVAAPTSVPGRLFAKLAEAALGSGRVHVDDPFLLWSGPEEFVDLRDCARAMIAALDAASVPTGVYNITHPAQHGFEDVVAAVRRVLGPLEVTHPPLPDTGFAGFRYRRPGPTDVSAATRDLGFSCAHDLDDTLAYWWRRG